MTETSPEYYEWDSLTSFTSSVLNKLFSNDSAFIKVSDRKILASFLMNSITFNTRKYIGMLFQQSEHVRTACLQLVDNLLQGCSLNILSTRLMTQQTCYNVDDSTDLQQGC